MLWEAYLFSKASFFPETVCLILNEVHFHRKNPHYDNLEHYCNTESLCIHGRDGLRVYR